MTSPGKKRLTALLAGVLLLPAAWWGYKKYRRAHPSPFVYHIKGGDARRPGYILFAPYALHGKEPASLMIMDMAGNVIVDRKVPGAVADFRQWHVSGHVRYTYIKDDPKAFHTKGIDLMAGYVVLLDSMLQEIKEIKLLPHGRLQLDKGQALDPHDMILLADDHWIVYANYESNAINIPDSLLPSPRLRVLRPVIQEVKAGKVIWQWDAADFQEFYALNQEDNDYRQDSVPHDYMHMNSIFLDPRDSNLICSIRKSDQVFKINRHTGAIMWRLGGRNSDFPMAAEQRFLRQHHATLTDSGNTLLLFDNGAKGIREHSRVLEFRLDETAHTITGFKAYQLPDPYSRFLSSVQKTREGHYFICRGTVSSLLEVDPNTGQIIMEVAHNRISYRGYLVDSIYGLAGNKKP